MGSWRKSAGSLCMFGAYRCMMHFGLVHVGGLSMHDAFWLLMHDAFWQLAVGRRR